MSDVLFFYLPGIFPRRIFSRGYLLIWISFLNFNHPTRSDRGSGWSQYPATWTGDSLQAAFLIFAAKIQLDPCRNTSSYKGVSTGFLFFAAKIQLYPCRDTSSNHLICFDFHHFIWILLFLDFRVYFNTNFKSNKFHGPAPHLDFRLCNSKFELIKQRSSFS